MSARRQPPRARRATPARKAGKPAPARRAQPKRPKFYLDLVARARTLWEEGIEPGRLVAVLGTAIALTAVALDLVINREITWLFDVTFVVVCVAMALRVRPADFFTVGVLPPLLMLGIFIILGVASPSVIADAGDGTIQAVVAGLAHHAGALITGYALCLGSLAMRQHVYRKRRSAATRSRIPAPRTVTREAPPVARPTASAPAAPTHDEADVEVAQATSRDERTALNG